MRYDAEHKGRTRQRLLTEAARAIRAEGPEKLAVAGLMAKVGLTHGGFYAHFPSRDALVAEAIAETFSDARAAFQRRTGGLEPRAALARYIAFYLSEAHRDARGAGCPLAAMAADLPRLEAGAQARFAEGALGLMARLSELLAAAGQDEPDALASSMVAELVGALSLARTLPDPAQSGAVLARSREALLKRLGLETVRERHTRSRPAVDRPGIPPRGHGPRRRPRHRQDHGLPHRLP